MLTLLAISFAFHGYVAARLLPALPDTAAWLVAGWLAVSAVLMPVGLLARRFVAAERADRLTWAGMLCMGLFSSLFVFTLARDALLLAAWLVDAWVADLPWAALLDRSALAVPVLAVVATAIGFLNARRTARVKTVDIPLPGLDPALRGFRIVQISDIHVGPTIKQPYLEKVVAEVNALQPDVVAITGDLVDGSVADLAPHVAPLAKLQARHGTFFVTGNHEYYSGVHGWVQELRRLGIRVLENEHVVLEHDHAPLVLAGVHDFSAGRFDPRHASDPEKALKGAPAGAVKVLLAHQPRSAPAAARAGFHLQISGHTHGGQFLPWGLFVPLQQPFTAGLHQLDRLWIYVSRGTGYWGPPKRLGAPSEITEIRLVPAA